MKILLLLSLVLFGCSASENSRKSDIKNTDDFVITGKWQFEWNKVIGDPGEWINAERKDTWSLLSFFGAETLSESTGKTMEFKSDNSIETDLVSQEMIDKLQFEYKFYQADSLIVFSAVSPKDSSILEIPTLITFDSDVMIWNIENLIAIKLNRID